MRIKTSVFTLALVMCTVFNVCGQHASAQTWTLPQGTTAKDNGPRTYRFIVDYNTANTRGEMLHRQRLTRQRSNPQGRHPGMPVEPDKRMLVITIFVERPA